MNQSAALRGKIGGLRTAALHDPRVTSAPGRDVAAQGLRARLLAEVDPDGVLSVEERERRYARAHKAYFGSLALKAAKSRRRNKAARGANR